MLSNQERDQVNQTSFRPWCKFGPILILMLFWLGSITGFIFAYLEDYIAWCIPHIEGCTSISRTGRSGASFYVFKLTMIPVAVFAFVYWLDMARWKHGTTPTQPIFVLVPTILGCLGAIALMSQMTFLGIDCGVCRTIRSYSTYTFFLLTFAAQWLAWIRIRKHSERNWVPPCYFILCLWLSLELVIFITIPIFIENTRALENGIAWRASYLISLAPAISAFGWSRTKGTL